MSLINEMEKLSLTLDFLTEQQAGQVIQLINAVFRDISNPHIIDVLWLRAGRDGMILDPLPYLCKDNSERGGALPYQITKDTTGLWAWIYYNDKPVWIKNVKKGDQQSPLKNEVTGDLIEPKYLDIFRGTDSIMAVPLKVENVLYGIYSIEWPISERLSLQTLELIKSVSKPLARICWKVETLKLNQQHTNEAINLFNDTMARTPVFESLSPIRTGFIARPFDNKFKVVENYIRKYLTKKKIHAQHFEHTPGRRVVIDEILKSIKSAHFGIVDITQNNPNVMLELGAMMILDKKLLLIRRKGQITDLPFDVRPFHIYQYEERQGSIFFDNPGSGESEPFEYVLGEFIDELKTDLNFVGAKEIQDQRRRR